MATSLPPKPKNLLFIEDDKEFAQLVVKFLEKRGFSVTHQALAQNSLKTLQKKPYHCLILDLGLPDEDGLILCQKIRQKETLPIIILTAKDAIVNKVKGLDLGADDYLTKPVSLRELNVRINRLLKRNLKDKFRSSVFEFDSIKFDSVRGKLTSGQKTLSLTPKEKAILEYLLLNQGQVLNRMKIMDHVWGDHINPFSNTVNVIICSLRKKLQQLSPRQFIHSIHGLGYKFEQ